MTHSETIVAFLRGIAPRYASNAEIVQRTGVRPHQQVFQITQRLEKNGTITGRKYGKEWEYRFTAQIAVRDPSPATAVRSNEVAVQPSAITPREFERLARAALEAKFNCRLPETQIETVSKRFDFVSNDRSIVGDAKYYTLVGGTGFPPAKMSVVSEHVWLLQNAAARVRFLVFGNEIAVPKIWLRKYGTLAAGVDFYFLSNDGHLQKLN